MFGFSKKKSEPVAPAPPAQNTQSITLMQPASKTSPPSPKPFTRVEDETASFQIPDFTEDDLNFDLGIGEFIPNQNQVNAPVSQNYAGDDMPPPAPDMMNNQAGAQNKFMQIRNNQQTRAMPSQGMQQGMQGAEQEMRAPQMQHQPLHQPQMMQQPQIPNENSQAPSMEVSKIQQPTVQPEEIESDLEDLPSLDEELAGPAKSAPSNTPVKKEESEFPEFSTEDDIPMFSVETETEKQRKAEEKAHAKNFKKEVDSFLEAAKHEINHPGIFMPYTVYEKVVILTEDTLKQSNNGDLAKNKVSSIMEHKKTQVEDLSKISKSIIDSLLNCDAKLFEKVGE